MELPKSQLLKSLYVDMDFLFEAEGPLEIKDVIANFPSNYKKVLQKMWGNDRLTFKGQKLFDGDDLGPAYKGAIDAAEKTMKKLTAEVDLPEDSIEAAIEDSQECYLGYDEKTDSLYIGFDAWLDEESFNEWALKNEPDDEGDEKGNWKAWKEQVFQGVLFGLKSTDGKNFQTDEEVVSTGGFYKSIYRTPTFKQLKLIDLRLD